MEPHSPLDQIPLPGVIHRHMGQLYRELRLLRRLLRLSQAAQEEQRKQDEHPEAK